MKQKRRLSDWKREKRKLKQETKSILKSQSRQNRLRRAGWKITRMEVRTARRRSPVKTANKEEEYHGRKENENRPDLQGRLIEKTKDEN